MHKVEPYVYAQMIAGKDATKPGEVKNSWLTGTAAWNFYTISQYILGIQPTYEGLRIDPCIPSDWKEYTVNRKFRGATFAITVKNPLGKMKGVSSLKIDGKVVKGDTIPTQKAGGVYQVEVIL